MLLLLLNRVPHAAIHRLLHVNHKAIENMDRRLCHLREAWVLDKEKNICFGQGQKWADVEADEATFDRMVAKQCTGNSGAGSCREGSHRRWYCIA